MEKESLLPSSFPTDGVELSCFLVVNNYARTLAFYRFLPIIHATDDQAQ
jgi:hypothetical protein